MRSHCWERKIFAFDNKFIVNHFEDASFVPQKMEVIDGSIPNLKNGNGKKFISGFIRWRHKNKQ